MSDEDFLKQFEAATWPFDQWHHREHIKVAYLYLTRHPYQTALQRMRVGVKALNVVHAIPEGPTRGYHETMTQTWMRLVYLTLCEHGSAESADAFYELNPQLSQPKILRLFYSQEVLKSPGAKIQFVEPDLAPLPRSKNVWTPR